MTPRIHEILKKFPQELVTEWFTAMTTSGVRRDTLMKEAELREQLAQRHPPVLLESLRDTSRPELDLVAARLGGGFAGTLLAEAEATSADPAALEALWDERAELRALRLRLRRLGVDVLETPQAGWVSQAGARLVEALHEEDGP